MWFTFYIDRGQLVNPLEAERGTTPRGSGPVGGDVHPVRGAGLPRSGRNRSGRIFRQASRADQDGRTRPCSSTSVNNLGTTSFLSMRTRLGSGRRGSSSRSDRTLPVHATFNTPVESSEYSRSDGLAKAEQIRFPVRQQRSRHHLSEWAYHVP